MRNSLKNIFLIVFVSVISLGLYQYYQNYSEARSFNNFLDSAALVSSLHLEASEEFKNLLDFSEISREEFENKIDKVCLLYTSPSPRDQRGSRMPSSA